MTDINKLPENLLVPEDDGGSSHLIGAKIASIELRSTNGLKVDLGSIKGKGVIYCYPMTGRPDVPLPDGGMKYRVQEVVHHRVVHIGITTKNFKNLGRKYMD